MENGKRFKLLAEQWEEVCRSETKVPFVLQEISNTDNLQTLSLSLFLTGGESNAGRWLK